jgi:hypothetical protein
MVGNGQTTAPLILGAVPSVSNPQGSVGDYESHRQKVQPPSVDVNGALLLKL